MGSHLTTQVAPSLLAGDFGRLAEEAKRIEDAGADALHFDIMDGHFVKNLTLGPKALGAVNKATDLFLDVHIMVYHPFEYIERLVENGADRITFHLEATEDVEETLNYIRKCNVQAGLAICPDTSCSLLLKYLNKCDLVLLMTVHPGFGGQAFIPNVLEDVKFLRETCDKLDLRKGGVTPSKDSPKDVKQLPGFDIQVDGGINFETAKDCVKAGANVLVSGSHLFKSKDMAASIKDMKKLEVGHS